MLQTIEASPEVAVKAADTSAVTTAPVHSNNTSEEFTSKVTKANNPREVQDLLNSLRNAPAQKAVEKPAEAPKSEAKVEKPAETEAPAEEAAKTEEASATEEAKTEEPATEEVAEEGDEDAEITPLFGKRTHLRLPPEEDKVGRMALAIVKRNKDITLEDAMKQAKSRLGIKDEAPAVAKEETVQTTAKTSDPLDTIEGITAEAAKLEEAYLKANEDLQFGDAAKISLQLRKLDKRLNEITTRQEREAAAQEQNKAAKYDEDFSKSEKRAGELYDFAADSASDGGKRMAEIDAALKASDDPLYFSPNKPLVIAQMVARELRIAPKAPGAKKPTTVKPVATTAPKTEKPKSVIPDGGGTTTPRTTDQPSKFNESVGSVKTLADLRRIQASVGLPH